MNYNTIVVYVAKEAVNDSGIWNLVYREMKRKLFYMNLEHVRKLDNHLGIFTSRQRELMYRNKIMSEIEDMVGYRVEVIDDTVDDDRVIAKVNIHATPSTYAHYQWGDGE